MQKVLFLNWFAWPTRKRYIGSTFKALYKLKYLLSSKGSWVDVNTTLKICLERYNFAMLSQHWYYVLITLLKFQFITLPQLFQMTSEELAFPTNQKCRYKKSSNVATTSWRCLGVCLGFMKITRIYCNSYGNSKINQIFNKYDAWCIFIRTSSGTCG